MLMTFSWVTLAAVRASARKRSRASSSCAACSVRIFTATVRPMTVSKARYTCDIPPPRNSCSSYLPRRAGSCIKVKETLCKHRSFGASRRIRYYTIIGSARTSSLRHAQRLGFGSRPLADHAQASQRDRVGIGDGGEAHLANGPVEPRVDPFVSEVRFAIAAGQHLRFVRHTFRRARPQPVFL